MAQQAGLKPGDAILDFSADGAPAVEIVRVPYSVMAAKAALEEGGLPGDFGLMLESGLT